MKESIFASALALAYLCLNANSKPTETDKPNASNSPVTPEATGNMWPALQTPDESLPPEPEPLSVAPEPQQTCEPAQQDDLDRRVTNLEKRVRELEQKTPVAASNSVTKTNDTQVSLPGHGVFAVPNVVGANGQRPIVTSINGVPVRQSEVLPTVRVLQQRSILPLRRTKRCIIDPVTNQVIRCTFR